MGSLFVLHNLFVLQHLSNINCSNLSCTFTDLGYFYILRLEKCNKCRMECQLDFWMWSSTECWMEYWKICRLHKLNCQGNFNHLMVVEIQICLIEIIFKFTFINLNHILLIHLFQHLYYTFMA